MAEKRKRLSLKDSEFLSAWIQNGGNAKKAELHVSPNISDESAESAGSRRLRRIQERYDFDSLLRGAGLGEARIAMELDKQLKAKKTVFHPSAGLEIVKKGDKSTLRVRRDTSEDNKTRSKALQLLIEVHGKRVGVIKQETKSEENITVKPYPIDKPDNSGTGE